MGPRLIIICGLPGSGKTTLARTLEAKLGAIRFAPDEWMDALSISLWDQERRATIEVFQWTLAQHLLSRGLVVIIEWGTWGKSERDRLRLRARELGAAVELHYLSATPDVLLDRIHRRGTENPPIERAAIVRWCEIFEVPTQDEIALFDQPQMASTSVDR